MDLNIREIEIFRAVMVAGSISRAAAALNVAQPAVSKYVAQLERRLRLKLFERYGNRIAPTAEARALFTQVERVFGGLGQLERFMHDMAQLRRGHVTVASLPLLSLTVMPQVVAGFTRARPDVSVALQTRSSARIAEWVAARQIDFGVGIYASAHSGVSFEPLVDLELFCALPPGHALADKDEIGVRDLAGQDVIALSNHDQSQIALDVLLDQHQTVPRRRIEVFWTSVALELAMRGAGLAFVDRLTAGRVPGGVDRLRRFRPRLSLQIGLFWPDHWEPRPIALALADAIRAELDLLLDAP